MAKIEEAANRVTAIKKAGHKQAVEVLNDLMHTAMGMAVKYQPPAPDQEPRDSAKFWKAMEMAGIFAKALAPYQSPTFTAIRMMISPDPLPMKTVENESNVIALNDPVAIMRIYQRRIKAVR
jgi:hypothetical protein